MPAEDYLTVQQIYRGWALLGIPAAGALGIDADRREDGGGNSRVFALTLAAAVCIGLTLVVFFLFTYPVNQQTLDWTTLPENWEALRRQWGYSHATGAGLYFVAMVLLTCSLLGDQE